ncbi:hypothetical protein HK102_007700, partial [Quaeritorhiza haematococci]
MRVDAVRVLYLHKYGGVYTDLDVESTDSLDIAFVPDGSWISKHQVDPTATRPWYRRWYSSLFSWSGSGLAVNFNPMSAKTFQKDQGVVLASMGFAHEVQTWVHSVPNAWMASRPGHPFWLYCIKYMMEKMRYIEENDVDRSQWGAEALTGPGMLHHVYVQYMNERKGPLKRDPVYMLSSDVIFPYDWDHNRDHTGICSSQATSFNAEECKKQFVRRGSTFAISYWSHSWGKEGNALLDEEKGLKKV